MRIFHDRRIPRRLAAAAAVTAALSIGSTSADYQGDAGWPENVVRYQIDLDNGQLELDREQADLDRRQAELDRRKHRYREKLEEASWRFRQLDANNDFWVTEKESVSMPTVARLFDSLDDDDNGKLSRHEFQDLAVATLRSGAQ